MSPKGSWGPATALLVVSTARRQDQFEQRGLCLGSKAQNSLKSRADPALPSANTPCLQCPGQSMGAVCIFQDQALCLDLGGRNTLTSSDNFQQQNIIPQLRTTSKCSETHWEIQLVSYVSCGDNIQT